jgi:hypothetical protein
MKTFVERNEIHNPNVPKETFVIAHWHTMSNEIGHTIYCDKTGSLWYVTDWKRVSIRTPEGYLPQTARPMTLHAIYAMVDLSDIQVTRACLHWLDRNGYNHVS